MWRTSNGFLQLLKYLQPSRWLPDPVVIVWRDTTYRCMFGLLLLSALASSSSVPLLAIFARDAFNASAFQINTYFTTTSALGLIVVLLIGRLSDGFISRRTLIVFGFTWLSLGYICLGFSNQHFFQMLLIGSIFFLTLNVTGAQLFALARDVLDYADNHSADSSIISILRTAYSFGWVVGSAISGFLLIYSDIRVAFWIAAIFYISSALIGMRYLPSISMIRKAPTINGSKGVLLVSRYVPLLVFSVAVAFLLSGDILRVAMLPIKLREEMQASSMDIGVAFSITPLLEVVLMPLVGMLADQLGTRRLIMAGAVSGILYYSGLVVADAVWQVWLLQGLYAFVVASIVGVGISYAQKLSQGESGLATSAFFSAQNAAIIGGSFLAGIMSKYVVPSHVFLLPAFLGTVGLVMMMCIRERKSLHESEGVPL